MEKPLTLKILSIITVFLGCMRVFAGISTLSENWDYLSQSGQMPYIIIENFLVGLFVILSGVFLFSGKSSGRLILIIGIIISLIINFIYFGKISRLALLTLVAISYFVIPDIQKFFSGK